MAIIDKKTDIVSSEANKAFDELIKKQEILLSQYKELVTISNAYQKELLAIQKTSDGTEAKKLVAVNKELAQTNKELTALDKERIKVNNQIKTTQAKLLSANEKNTKILAKGKVALQEKNRALKQEAILTSKVTGEYKKQSTQLIKLKTSYKNLAVQNKGATKEARALLAQITKLDTKLKQVDATVGNNQRKVGSYKDALKGLGGQLLGAAGVVGGIQLAVDAGKAFVNKVQEMGEISRKVESTFDVFGKKAKTLAVNISAIANTFDQDYNEILQAANTVSKELDISASQALKHIEEGFLKGSNNSGEFIDILKEYPAQFKAVGIDADTAFSIINRQVKEGIYSDKGVDAIKEGGLRLRENTKAVQDALKPLDESIKKQIEQEVAAGNSFKAIQLVSQALNDTSLTAEETQKIVADVFGGAGEDAGLRYLQLLGRVEGSLENVAIQSSASEIATLNLDKSWSGFTQTFSDSNNVFGKVWSFFKNALAGAINSVTRLTELISGGNEKAKALKGLSQTTLQITRNTKEQTKANEELATSNNKVVASQRMRVQTERQLNAERNKRIQIETSLFGLQSRQIQESDTEFSSGGDLSEAVPDREDLADEEIEFQDVANARKLEQEKEYQSAKKEIADAFLNETAAFAKDVFNQDQDTQIKRIKEDAKTEEAILKDKLEKGLITETAYRAGVEKVNKKAIREEAKAEKKKALFGIAINTALGVIKALPNYILSAVVLATGAIQAAFVASKPLPSFERGEVNIKGLRHSQGGINANIEANESVINRKGTMNAPKALEAINNGLLSDSEIYSGMNKTQTAGLQASLLMQGNKINSQILTALENGVSQYEHNGVRYTIFANGSSVKKEIRNG